MRTPEWDKAYATDELRKIGGEAWAREGAHIYQEHGRAFDLGLSYQGLVEAHKFIHKLEGTPSHLRFPGFPPIRTVGPVITERREDTDV